MHEYLYDNSKISKVFVFVFCLNEKVLVSFVYNWHTCGQFVWGRPGDCWVALSHTGGVMVNKYAEHKIYKYIHMFIFIYINIWLRITFFWLKDFKFDTGFSTQSSNWYGWVIREGQSKAHAGDFRTYIGINVFEYTYTVEKNQSSNWYGWVIQEDHCRACWDEWAASL